MLLIELRDFLASNAQWIVSVCAIVVSVVSLRTQRRHFRLSVQPKLVAECTHGAQHPYLWTIENRGVGPAVLTDVRMRVGQNEIVFPDIRGTDSLLNGAGLSAYKDISTYNKGDYFKVGTVDHLLRFNEPDVGALKEQIKMISWVIHYESMYGDKYQLDIKPAEDF